MQTVAEAWLVYRLTGSAALLGVAGFASQIPVFLLATIGGTVADRSNRHRILVITQSTAMVLPLILGDAGLHRPRPRLACASRSRPRSAS